MVDLRNAKPGDKLLTVHGNILTYVGPEPLGSYYDHRVKYPALFSPGFHAESYGTRTHDGFVYRKNRREDDEDIIAILDL